MHAGTQPSLSKVPEVTLIFWIIKIAATTLGETGGDAVSMSMNRAIRAQEFAQFQHDNAKIYPCVDTIIATTTLGTTLADFADRSLGIGYAGGTAVLPLLGRITWHAPWPVA